MVNLKEFTDDIQELIKSNYTHLAEVVSLAITNVLQDTPSDQLVTAFKQANFEASTNDTFFFLTVEDTRLKVLLRPLQEGDHHDSE